MVEYLFHSVFFLFFCRNRIRKNIFLCQVNQESIFPAAEKIFFSFLGENITSNLNTQCLMRIDCQRNCNSKMRPFKCSSIHGRPFTCVVGFFHKCGVKKKLLFCIINSFQCKSVKIDMTKNYSIGKLIMLMMYYSEQIIEHEFALFATIWQ